jgi:UDP-sulfoquinovose synthase
VELAIRHPAQPGEFRVFNQFTESFSVNELAEKVAAAAGGAEIVHLDDPRVELEEHYYRAAHTKLLDLGLLPFLLDDDLLTDLLAIARTHIGRLDRSALRPQVSWRSTSSPLARAPKHQPGRGAEREQRPSDRSV